MREAPGSDAPDPAVTSVSHLFLTLAGAGLLSVLFDLRWGEGWFARASALVGDLVATFAAAGLGILVMRDRTPRARWAGVTGAGLIVLYFLILLLAGKTSSPFVMYFAVLPLARLLMPDCARAFAGGRPWQPGPWAPPQPAAGGPPAGEGQQWPPPTSSPAEPPTAPPGWTPPPHWAPPRPPGAGQG